ncbi:uncharacterized protein LOC143516968 isoform X2 [Brachyhypopomus gauderio]|uniref:uncharacterized protein LOC143516968 isoform X2 n=1 Tax=Brachyhypopomus gauderio TaxID=698409 RepID=UPI00404296A2
MSLTVESNFNVVDVLKLPQSPISEREPKIEQLLNKLRQLQQAKEVLEDDVREVISQRSTLQDEEDLLTTEVLKLQGTLNEKEETCRSLQIKCEDLEKESQRQFELKQQKEELLQQCSCQIQETKLKHRKIRMKFENQLQQLMEQHKNLCTVFAQKRLPAEVQSSEYNTEQLLKAEHQKLEQLAHLEEELNNAQAIEMQSA